MCVYIRLQRQRGMERGTIELHNFHDTMSPFHVCCYLHPPSEACWMGEIGTTAVWVTYCELRPGEILLAIRVLVKLPGF